jgi:hypothetical protein
MNKGEGDAPSQNSQGTLAVASALSHEAINS